MGCESHSHQPCCARVVLVLVLVRGMQLVLVLALVLVRGMQLVLVLALVRGTKSKPFGTKSKPKIW